MGYTFAAGDWMQPPNDAAVPAITDALHAFRAYAALLFGGKIAW